MRGVVAALVAVLAGGGAVPLGSGPAEAKETEEFTIGQWTGFSYTSEDTGQFTDCTAWALNRDKVQLGISVRKDWSLDLWLNSESWNLPANQSYPISFWIDGNRQYRGRAETNTDKYVVIEADYDQDVFNELQNGSRVTFRTQNLDYVFDLSQSRAALNRLLDCVDQYSKQAATNPFGDQTGDGGQTSGGGQSAQPFGPVEQQDSGQSAITGEAGGGSSVLVKDLTLSTEDVRRFLVDVTGAKPSMIGVEAKTGKSGYSYYMFTTPIGDGQFWQEHLGGETLRDVVDFYVEDYRADCKGEFNQVVRDPVRGDRGQTLAGTVTCSNSTYQKGEAEVMSFMVKTTDGDLATIYVSYVGGNAAKAKTDNLGKLIARRMEAEIR
jgi:hypothetical protein